MSEIKCQKSSLTKEEIKHVAKLAGLFLTPKEIKKFSRQLSDILEYINQLKQINTENIEPTCQVTGLENVSREDKPKVSLAQPEALSGTKNIFQGMFKVKAIFK